MKKSQIVRIVKEILQECKAKPKKISEMFSAGSFLEAEDLGIDPEQVEVELYDNGNYLTLNKILIKGDKKQGLGTKAMKKIADYADNHDMNIYLTPSTSYGASSTSRLEKFYKRFGFEKNQDKVQSRDTMVRFPN